MEDLGSKIDLVISWLFDLRDMVMEDLKTKIGLVISRYFGRTEFCCKMIAN